MRTWSFECYGPPAGVRPADGVIYHLDEVKLERFLSTGEIRLTPGHPNAFLDFEPRTGFALIVDHEKIDHDLGCENEIDLRAILNKVYLGDATFGEELHLTCVKQQNLGDLLPAVLEGRAVFPWPAPPESAIDEKIYTHLREKLTQWEFGRSFCGLIHVGSCGMPACCCELLWVEQGVCLSYFLSGSGLLTYGLLFPFGLEKIR